MTVSRAQADVKSVLAEFDKRKNLLEKFCEKTKGLIEESLQDAGLKYHSVQARVKGREKLETKYLDPDKDYKKLDDITDLAGLRVITYYEDEVDAVAELIRREFKIDLVNSVDKRVRKPDTFGYTALNLVCTHLPSRTSTVEYKRLADVVGEIQITSVLSHAWAEIEHGWYDLGDALPDEIKREFSRLKALLEIAEANFIELRKKRTSYERSVAVQVEAQVPELALDPVSLNSFIQQDRLVLSVDESIGSILEVEVVDATSASTLGLRMKAVNFAGLTEVQDVREAMGRYQEGILEYVERCRKFWIVSSEAKLGRGICLLPLGILMAGLGGEDQAADAMASLSLSIAFNANIRPQFEIIQEILRKYAGG
jgi:putative GTP pyrophosphokinase